MVKEHGVGLAIKEEITKQAGEDGIAIECISACLLKAQISMKSNFVTFVVAYAPTEEAPEGQMAKYITALNSTVASIPAREYAFVLTDANARTGKRGEGGGEADSKVLGAYGRDVLNQNGKLLLVFAEDNKLALLNTCFCTPKSGVFLHVPKRQPQQGTITFVLYPDKKGGPPTHPLRSCTPPPLRGTIVGSQSRIRESSHPTQVCTKLEEDGQYKENSVDDRV